MVIPILKFRELTQSELAVYAERILVKMTENQAFFPYPEPSLTVLDLALASYREALAAAAYRDKRAVAIKDQQREVLKSVMFQLSLYVTKISMGDRSLILAAGFFPSKEKAPIGSAPKPLNFRVEMLLDNSGHVRLRVKAWKPTLVYQFEYRKMGEEETWSRAISSKSSCILSELEPLARYEFRVAYIHSFPLVTYSDVVSSYVL